MQPLLEIEEVSDKRDFAPAALRLLELSDIDDHPDNPRLVIREDVVNGIAANLETVGEYPQKHAIHVRPVGGRFQILSGHHRKRGAQKAGLSHLWAWVEEMDDTAALMQLVLANNQGELSPLEIGIHALKAVPTAQGREGAGIASYARQLGKAKSTVSECRTAAMVLATCSDVRTSLMDKANHLYQLSRLPSTCWPTAAEWLKDSKESVKEVSARVDAAAVFGEAWKPGDWADYLPLDAVVSLRFCGTEPNVFRNLLNTAQKVFDELPEDLAAQWRGWLIANRGGESYNIQKVQEERIRLEQEAWSREEDAPAEENAPVQVLLADPPWRYDFAETTSRQIENQYPTATPEEIGTHLQSFGPELSEDCVLFLWATAPKLIEALTVMAAWGFEYKTQAVWDKQRTGMGYWFRGRHEILLVGTRGNPSPPAPDRRFESVFVEARENKHSRKPECVYRAIESMFPDAVRAEMYCRGPREGWQGFGNEAKGLGL